MKDVRDLISTMQNAPTDAKLDRVVNFITILHNHADTVDTTQDYAKASIGVSIAWCALQLHKVSQHIKYYQNNISGCDYNWFIGDINNLMMMLLHEDCDEGLTHYKDIIENQDVSSINYLFLDIIRYTTWLADNGKSVYYRH